MEAEHRDSSDLKTGDVIWAGRYSRWSTVEVAEPGFISYRDDVGEYHERSGASEYIVRLAARSSGEGE
jgi:hypothetical protein